MLAEGVVVELVERRADDAVVLGHQRHLLEVEQAGNQLATSEVTCRAEQHEHVRLGLWERAVALDSDIRGTGGHNRRDTRVARRPVRRFRVLEGAATVARRRAGLGGRTCRLQAQVANSAGKVV